MSNPKTPRPIWLTAKSGDFDAFKQIVAQSSDPVATPMACDIVQNIPIYAGAAVDLAAADPAQRAALMAEWSRIFAYGAGIIVIRQGVADHSVIDRASVIFDQIIAAEKQAAKGGGDHFGRDLTKLAEENKLDPVVGREKEIERVSQVLSRRKKNNPLLIGEPGV